ncbi:hypothetical protein ACFV3E_14845 [Streptomyces sp. NPDC059718]
MSGSDEVGEFIRLRNWLSGERTLTGAVRVVVRPPGDGELGGAFDLLAVTLGSGGVGVSLARSLTVWLQTRRTDVTITVTSPSGTVKVDAQRIKDSAVVELLERALQDHDER